MIKLSKVTWIFLTIGIFGILAFSLNMAYSQQSQERSRLNEELSSAQLRLKQYPTHQLSSQQKELESRLAKAESQLIATKASLFQSIESIQASDTIFDIAEICNNVEVTEISSSSVTTETLEGVVLSVLPLTVTIEGDVLDLIDFISKWTKEYPTGVVKTVEIGIPELIEEEEEAGKPSAIINLLIYTYVYEGN